MSRPEDRFGVCFSDAAVTMYQASCRLKIAPHDRRGTCSVAVEAGAARPPRQPPVLLEHLKTKEEYDQARGYVFSLAQQIGKDDARS